MEKPRVLIVDDEADFREAIVKLLNKRDMAVTGAETGEKALELLGAQRFDVVVMDFKMPGMDGIQTLKALKKNWPDTEVIMLTAIGSVESGIEGMQSGAFDYVLKPADIDDLIEKIRQAHERKLIHEGRVLSS
jgi:DNA-binding NtrC family response regulator